MPEISPQLERSLVYDDDDEDIRVKAAEIDNLLRVYTRPGESVTCSKISDWDGAHSENDKTLFFVSIETEEFHRRIKKMIKPENKNMLVLLKYKHSPKSEHFVNSIIKDIKRAAKGDVKEAQKERMKAVEDRIVKVSNLNDSNTWWPKTLNFLCGGPCVRRGKEIGVSFLFDEGDEKQMDWFSRQRRTLEECFQTRCLKLDTAHMDKYVMNSESVVLYLSANELYNTYKEINNSEDRRGSLLTETQTSVLECVMKHGCRPRVFVNKLTTKFDRALVRSTDKQLKMTGEGQLEYWMGLLHDLKLVKIQPRQDPIFYSNCSDKNFRAHFQPPDRRPETTRQGYLGSEIGGPSGIGLLPVHGDSLRSNASQTLYDVSYVYGMPLKGFTDHHDNDRGSPPDRLQDGQVRAAVCCNLMNLFRRNR